VFDFYYTQAMLIMVILGGAGSFWPVVVAAIVFTIIPEALRLGDEMRMVLYGALLVVAMVVIPSGYGGVLQERRLARWQKAAR
jgi:ABC-type branched-subunit amino acid transport system permease subunit